MKRVFISQPMKGKTNEEITLKRNEIIEKIKNRIHEDVEIVDSFMEDAPHDANPLWFLGKSLQYLSTADMAYFDDDWNTARGCKIEHQCAVDYNITIIND